MVKPLTLEMSGSGVTDFALPEVKELARVHGLELDAFFSAYGVKALSTFRKKFAQEALAPPTPRAAAPTGLATVRAKAETLLAQTPERRRPPPAAPPACSAARRQAPARLADACRRTQSFEPAKPPPCEPMPLAEYGALAAKWEKSLKWRLVRRSCVPRAPSRTEEAAAHRRE